MESAGDLKKSSRGRFPLGENVKRYIAYKTKTEISDESIAELEKKKLAADADWKASRARISEMNEQELRGKLHRSEDVEAITSDLIYAVRSALTALPGRLAPDLAAAQTPAEAADKIRKETFFVMKELSLYQYDPQRYRERVRERQKWEAEQEEYNEDAPSVN